MEDPFYDYNPTENVARIYYYPPHYDGYYYVPYAWIDGIIRGSYLYDQWGSMMLNRYDVESPLEIQLGGEFDEGVREGSLDITIIAHEQISQSGLKVRIALAEDSLYFEGPNGTLWHNYTMRDIIPDVGGISLDISQGETVELSQSFSCPNPLVIDQCKLIVWVQADSSGKEILQTGRIRVDALGQVSVDDLVEMPTSFKLDQNYPNPFNASTTINFSLSEPQFVTLKIYDLLGKEIQMLADEQMQAGMHSVTFDASELSSGVYFYRIQADDYSESKRMVLLK